MAQPKLLVPREATDPLGQELERLGIPIVCAPVTKKIPTSSEDWHDPMRRLQDGEYEWTIVSSVATVRFLDDYYVLPELLADTRVATVGAATAESLRQCGVKVDLVGPDPASATALLGIFPEGSGAVFLPCAAGAAPTLGQGLTERGWTVEKLRLYETVALPELPVTWEAVLHVRDNVFMLITAGSVARAAHEQMRAAQVLQWPTPIAFGASSAEVCRQLGWPAVAVCPTTDAEGIRAAYQEALEQLKKKS